MKRYFLPILAAVFLAVVVLLGVGNYISSKNKIVDDSDKPSVPASPTPSTTPPVVVVPAPEIIAKVKSVLLEDKVNGFKIWYPETAQIDKQGGNYLGATKTAVAQILISPSLFIGTNLHEAVVAIGIDTDPTIVASCQQAINGDQAQGFVTISGKDFSLFTGTDAGAGNLYDYRDYRRAQNGKCYEITEVLHSSNIGNYEPGTIKEFNKKYFSGVLDKMATSFEFIN